MRDNQKIYLDKVVGFLVRDTRIDDYYIYQDEPPPPTIQFPFPPYFLDYFPPSPSRLLSDSYFLRYTSFSNYCKDVYGLTNQEIRYVWDQYKDIITDKIENGK